MFKGLKEKNGRTGTLLVLSIRISEANPANGVTQYEKQKLSGSPALPSRRVYHRLIQNYIEPEGGS